ncbi:MAG: hypothetical protein ACI4MQ_02370 [Candidatus Coproplasma sp.]
MIHYMGGGVISQYENLIYCFVEIEDGAEVGVKRWYISPFVLISVGDKVVVPSGKATARGEVKRIENVTAQTAPFPVKRTQEILSVTEQL